MPKDEISGTLLKIQLKKKIPMIVLPGPHNIKIQKKDTEIYTYEQDFGLEDKNISKNQIDF